MSEIRMSHLGQRLVHGVFIAALLVSIHFLGHQAGAETWSAVSSEDFNTAPNFTTSTNWRSADGDRATWNSTSETFEVYVKEYGPGAHKYAQTPEFQTIENSSFRIKFDMNYLHGSFGMGMNIRVYLGEAPVYGTTWQNALRFQLHDHVTGNGLQLYDAAGNKVVDYTQSVKNRWLQVTFTYNHAAGTADLLVIDRTTQQELVNQTGFTYVAGPFQRLGFGDSTRYWDGTDAEMHIDNIEVSSPSVINPPTVTTTAISGITTTTAASGGNVTSDGGAQVMTRGVCWSTSSNPTTSDSKTTNDSGTGSFTSDITGLSPNTTYYVRAYATNSEGTAYGSNVSFTTAVVVPTATSGAATSVTSSSATLNGTVNPNGASTTVTFEYGTTTSYGSTVTASQSPLSGTTSQAVSAGITGLTPGATYHCQVKAQNSAGTSYGSDVSFTASADAPTVSTSAANPVGSNSATLNGTVNPNGSSATVTFEYGATTGYGSTVTASQSPLTGTSAQSVSAGISSLNANATYHFRVRATNSAGTTDGSDQAFTTASVVPTVATGSASSVDSESAMLNGTIDPNGLSSTYYFEYGTTANYGTITGIRSAGSGWGAGDVSAYIAGLKPGATYHYRLVGNNSVGTSDGADKTFTTSAPPATAPTVTTGWATSVRRCK